jgi:hypothetical protein
MVLWHCPVLSGAGQLDPSLLNSDRSRPPSLVADTPSKYGYPQVHSYFLIFILLLSFISHIFFIYVQLTLSRYHRTRLRVSLIPICTLLDTYLLSIFVVILTTGLYCNASRYHRTRLRLYLLQVMGPARA